MEKNRKHQPRSDELRHIRSSGSGWILLAMLAVLVILFAYMAIKG